MQKPRFKYFRIIIKLVAKEKIEDSKWKLIAGLVLIALLIFAVFTTISAYRAVKLQLEKNKLHDFAEQIFAGCKNAEHPTYCYDEEIPKLLGKISIKNAFEIAQEIAKIDKSYTHCHMLGHFVAEVEVKKDPSKWKEVLRSCPTDSCNGGCLHGTIEARFKSERLSESKIQQISPELKDICTPQDNWNPQFEELTMCYHALGHLNMYLTSGNLNKSIELCNYIGQNQNKWYKLHCLSGIFMMVYQSFDEMDTELTAQYRQTKETVLNFCNKYTETEKSVCIIESFPLFMEELKHPQKANELCSQVSSEEREYCRYKMLAEAVVIHVIRGNNVENLADYCREIGKTDLKNKCFNDASQILLEINSENIKRAITLCSISIDPKGCFEKTADFVNSNFKSELNSICKNFPQEWKKRCSSRKFWIFN